MAAREACATGLLPLYLAIGALFAALGLWVLLAAPKRNLNRALAAVLLLWAGSSIVFQLYRDTTTAEAHAAYRAIGSLYEVPTPFLFAYIVDELFLPKPRSRARKAVLAGVACFAVVMGAAFLGYAWEGDTVPGSATLEEGGTAGFTSGLTVVHGFVPSLQGSVILVSESVAVIVASRAAAAAPPDSITRKQAVLVALAFGFLAGHNGGLGLGGSIVDPAAFAWPKLVITASEITGLVAAGYALVRLPGAAQATARTAVTLLVVLPVALGFFGVTRPSQFAFAAFFSARFLWVTAFAIGLALAILRYDLAGLGGDRSRQRAALTAGLLAFGIAGIAAGGAVSALGTTPLGLGVGLALLASPLGLTLPPLQPLRKRFTSAVSLDSRDPSLDPERARIYASTLRTAAAEHGAVPAAGDPALRELRDRLGLSERDHELLASALDTRTEALTPGTLFLGRYRIARELGRGGFGEAFLARDEREGRDVVLKRLHGDRSRDAQALRRFQRELRLAATVEHPNIVAVYGTEAGADGAYLVMEYLEGGSLADRLRTSGPLTEADATTVARDALAGLAALHARGIVHRDIKPGNILLTAEGRAKLGDFTIAREVISGETEGGAGRAPVGTLAYIAPEQARGMAATPQSDLYSLGASIYEALAGRPPVDLEGLTDYEASLRIACAAPKLPLDGASTAMNAWLAAALAKDPPQRPADARAMAAALPGASKALTPAGTPAGSAPRPRRRPA